MSNISILNTRDNVDLTDANLVDVGTYLSTTSTVWSWKTPGGLSTWSSSFGDPHVEVRVIGTGFTYSGNELTGGTVDRIELDFGGSHPTEADVVITNLTGLSASMLNDSVDDFWFYVLAGGTYFNLNAGTDAFSSTDVVFGDARNLHATVTPFSINGGDDQFFNLYWRTDAIGDVFSVQGALLGGIQVITSTVTGGDDVMVSSGGFSTRLVGDVWEALDYGVVIGGNDRLDNSINTSGGAKVAGDVYDQNGGTVTGGDDRIDTSGHDGTGLPAGDTGSGDVWSFAAGNLTGGDDFIQMHGGGNVAGDVLETTSGATGIINGGDDTIFGSTYNDFIVGDVYQVNSANVQVTGGNDDLHGGFGADIIYGDAVEGVSLIGTMALVGGNDRLFGDQGDDTLYGQSGDDILDGGAGNDTLIGGDDFDWASYASANQGVTINLFLGTTSGAGNDVFIDIEAFEGSRFNDTFIGDAGDNVFSGGMGDQDKAEGGAGNDILDGGFGTDDIVSYESATSGVTVSLAISGSQATGGAGFDTISGFEQIYGSNHGDTLTGDGGNNALIGLDGNDKLYGGDGGDLINGDNNNDMLFGEAGSDILNGGPGADMIDGGTGTDTASYIGSAVGVNVQLQYNVATGGDATGDTLTSIENLTGSDKNDTLIGNPGANTLSGGAGNDILKGLNGADSLFGGGGDDWLYVDSLDILATGDEGIDRLVVVNGNGVTNSVGANGIEIATGNAGNDRFYGGASSDDLTLTGRAGDDILHGGSGDDSLFGDAGADQLRGGAGLDRLYVDENDTVIDGGMGDEDRVIVQQLASAASGVSVDMAASNVEIAYGGVNDDTFDGSGATVALSLYGRNGQDILTGGTGNDRLFGDNNDAAAGDILNGGLGNDFLHGGENGGGGFAERDQFVFDANWGFDRIFDFANNSFEKIDFSSIAGITQLSDLTISNGLGYALISYTDGGGWTGTIRVDNTTVGDFTASDFIFV
ncbi:MAG: hypothetical protein KDJ77_11115 [Rhodobiaceae bacterium]|nr:hypothetical protein [Rhodobiaceae bacterium]